MSRIRSAGIVPVIEWTLPVFALATGLSAARADELGDLRANQELLQRRVDPLAQVPPPPAGAGPGGPGRPTRLSPRTSAAPPPARRPAGASSAATSGGRTGRAGHGRQLPAVL